MSNHENYYKELPLFNEIENPTKRAWNRLNIINNLRSANRQNDAKNYFEKLDRSSKGCIALLLMAIKKKGIDTVRAEIGREDEATNYS
jgi:hypothetical protein